MKFRAMLFVSLSALAFSAGSANAAPVIGFIQGVVAGLAGSALLGGTIASAGFMGGVVASTYIGGTFLGRLALTVGINVIASNAIVSALNRPRMPTPQDQIVNLSQPLSYMQRVYGRVRKGGPVIFTGFRDSARHYAVAIAAHRTKGPVTHWLDTFEVAINGAGEVTTEPVAPYGNIRTYRGLPGQAVDPILQSTFAEVTSSFDFAGISYAAIRAKKPSADALTLSFPNGREWTYSPVWDGWDEIYDPRTNTYGWTNNAALVMAHEAIFHGKTVIWSDVAIEADVCDTIVLNGDGNSQKLWTLNMTLDDSVTWEQARDDMARACDAFFYETVDGHVGFMVGRYIEPSITLVQRDFLSLTRAEKAWGPDIAGEAVIKYVEPGHDYQQATSGAIVVEAGLPRLEDELWGIDSHNQACRVAKRQIRQARAQYSLEGTIKLIGYELIRKRFFRVNLTDPAMNLVFEVEKLLRNGDGVSFTLKAFSVEEDDFKFYALTEEPARPQRASVISDNTVPAISGLAGSAVTGTGGVAQIEWSWPSQDASLTQIFQSRRSGTTSWQQFSVAEGQRSLVVSGLIDGASYEAQVRNRTASGKLGGWSPKVTVTAVANTTAPPALAAFSVEVSGGTTGAVTFTSPDSPNYAATRIYRGTTTSFSAASLVRTEYGIRNAVDGWNDTGLAAGTYRYWGEPINASGITGPRTGPVAITII
jgi:hypothetical protein